jgi:hypothetical protein
MREGDKLDWEAAVKMNLGMLVAAHRPVTVVRDEQGAAPWWW